MTDKKHFGQILQLRRENLKMSLNQLSAITGIKKARIIEIEANGICRLDEKDILHRATHRFAYVMCQNSNVGDINDQYDIKHGLQQTLLTALKKHVRADIYNGLVNQVEELMIEAEYFGVVVSRADKEELVIDRVKERRKIK